VTRLIVVAAAAIGLILFVAFIVSRLVRARTRGMSIRMQVFLALGVIVGAFAFGLGLMVIDRIESRAVRIASRAALDEAQAIAGFVAGELDRTGTSLDELARYHSERDRGAEVEWKLLDHSGRVVFPARRAATAEDPGSVSEDAPIVHAGHRVGTVRVVKPAVAIQRLLADFAPTVLVISLMLGAVAAVAAAWIGRAIAKPIEALTAFSERVSAGQRAVAPAAVFGREVTQLTRSIDSMRRQLEGRPFVETFAMDLSHELKNPVAAVRAAAEVLEEGAIDDPEAARRFVARIREAAARIERLLGDLVSLARIESRGAESFEPVDLGQIARAVLEAHAETSARVRLRVDGDTRVRGDAAWLGRALGNLIDNAYVHAEADSIIELDVQGRHAEVDTRVKSAGSIARHVRGKLFRRFVTTRPDKGGSGLGLAIVRAVAEAHRGSIELQSAGPPEVEFRFTLPSARFALPGPLGETGHSIPPSEEALEAPAREVK
jgi:signal transduction histidine kinase